MELQPYLLIEAPSPALLEARCREVLLIEEEEEEWVFYYIPHGAPFTAITQNGSTNFLQAFLVSSHPEVDEVPVELTH